MQDVGTTVGGYEILRQLTPQLAITTFLARGRTGGGDAHPRGTREVALHVSRPLEETARDRECAEQFRRDAVAVSEVDHPAIAKVVDVGRDGDRVFVATSSANAVTLDELIAEHWQLTPQDVILLMGDLASGLDVVHARGIVHGALSPHTIWVERRDDEPATAFVSGFGAAALAAGRLRAGRGGDDAWLLESGLYAAPEQLLGKEVDGRADQYSLACAIYHCLTGEPPFVRDALPALIGAHLFARPTKLPAETDPALRRALTVGMAKRPDDRYPSCSHLLRASRVAGTPVVTAQARAVAAGGVSEPDEAPRRVTPPDGVGGGARATSDLRTAAAAWWARDRRRAWLVPTLALLAGITVILTGAGLFSGDDPPPETAAAAAQAESDGNGSADGDEAAAQGRADEQLGDETAVLDGDAARQRVTASAPGISWRATVDGGSVRTVLATDGVTVVTTDAGLLGLDPDTGDRRWEHPVAGEDVSGVTLVGDRVVYRSVGVLEGLDVEDGEELWARSDRYTPGGNLTTAPRTLYGVGPGRVLPEIMAINPQNGRERWHFHGEDVDISSDAGIAASADVVTIAQDGALIAFDPGAELGPSGENRREIEDALWVVDLPNVHEESVRHIGDHVLLVTGDGEVCSHRLDDGRQSWCQPINGADGPRSPTILADGRDAATVVTEATTATLDVASGDVRWQVDANGRHTGAATMLDDTVVVAERSGAVRALSLLDGSERWMVRVSGPATALATDDAALYAGTDAGRVLRLDPTDR